MMPAVHKSNDSSMRYVGQLTALRGVACVFVLFGHVVQVINYHAVSGNVVEVLADRLITGAFNAEGAVLLFFVLSGCVLSISLKNLKDFNLQIVLGFYIKRIFRLYPLLWIATFLAISSVLAAHSLSNTGAFAGWLSRNLQSPVTLAHTVLSMAGVWTEYDGPMWSLRVELIYSALFPIIYIFVRSPRARGWFIAAMFGLALLPVAHPQYGTAFGFSFAIGAAIPLLSCQNVKLPGLIVFIAVLALCYDRLMLAPYSPPDFVYNIIETISAFILIRHIYVGGNGHQFLNAAPIIRAGELSFSIYLLHLPVLLVIFMFLQRFFGLEVLLSHPVATQCGLGLTTMTVTILLSIATYTFIELPLHNIGRYLGGRLIAGRASHMQADLGATAATPVA